MYLYVLPGEPWGTDHCRFDDRKRYPFYLYDEAEENAM